MALLERRFGNRHLLGLFERVLGHLPGGIGLPIGTLTSQHLANYYLDGLDRYLLAHPEVGGMVRYMDDIIVWCRTTQAAIRIRERARAWLWWERGLTLRPDAQIGRTAAGVPFLGFLVCRGRLGLLRRRRRRLVWAVRRWTRRFRRGEIGEAGYQRGLDAALAGGAGADMDRWRAAAMKNWVGEEA